mmetsp:Transcript_14121/g.29285  ORF Transcript_14121/g.29285 Transcript_14121/m.29285 type:complete len:245 (-) Transcript_14121:124-858(-)
MNVNGRGQNLRNHGNGQGATQFCGIAFDTMFFHQEIRRLGSHIKGRIHGGAIPHGKESNGTHRGLGFDGSRCSRITGKNGIAPGQEGNVGDGRSRYLEGLALTVILDFVNIQGQFGQVGHGIGSKVHSKCQDKGFTSQELLGLENHFASRDTHILHEGGGGTNVLDNAFVNDTNQGTDQKGSGKGTSNFLGGSDLGFLDKLMSVEMRITKFPITSPQTFRDGLGFVAIAVFVRHGQKGIGKREK